MRSTKVSMEVVRKIKVGEMKIEKSTAVRRRVMRIKNVFLVSLLFIGSELCTVP